MKIIIYIFSILVFISCKKPLIGACDTPIHTSVSLPEVMGQQSVYTIKVTKSFGWWISSINVNGTYLSLDTINTSLEVFKIQNDTIGIERLNKSDLKIFLDKEENVDLNIMLQAGNCFKSVELKQ